MVVELTGYVTAWAGFALASLAFAEVQNRRAEWPHFLAAWNWANVVQYIVLILLMVPGALGLPAPLGSGLGLAALGYALWLEWYVAKTALRIEGGQAALLVGVDLAIGIFVNGLVGRIGG
jgi:hypothetical protein